MTLEPYDIKQDDRATELNYRDCPEYHTHFGLDIGSCGFDDRLCTQEVDPPCPVLEEILEEVESGN